MKHYRLHFQKKSKCVPIIIACSNLPAKEIVCLATYRQASAHAKRKAAECLLYKCNSRVSEVHAIHMQDGDSYKLFGSEGQSIKYKSQKVAL